MDKQTTRTTHPNEQIDSSRRSIFLKGTAGLVVAGTALPASWTRPVVDAVLLPAHAQTSALLPLDIADPVPPASGPVDTPDPVDSVNPGDTVDPVEPVDPADSASSSSGGKVTPAVDTPDGAGSSSSSGADSGASGSGGDSGDGPDSKKPPKSDTPA